MTITQCGQLLGSILAAYTSIPANRIIIKNEKFDAPKDGDPYILIDYDGQAGRVGFTAKQNATTTQETMTSTSHERFSVELCGFGQSATDRKEEIPMALRSSGAIRAAEDANCSIYVAGPTLDLSSIEGSSALRRYRIPVIISNIERKTMAANLIDKFPAIEISTEAK